MIATTSPITPEQLLALPENQGLEIVRGQIVEKRVGYVSSELGLRVAIIVGWYCLQKRLGHVSGSDGGFQCFPDDPNKVRKPDVAFVSYEKLPVDEAIGAYCKVVPDLAIEVLSPNDEAREISDKIKDYLSVGVPLIWIVNGFLRQVEVYEAGKPRVLTLSDELTAEPVLPGFRCLVSDLFERIPADE